jgi:hypothetical protein
MVGTSPLVVKVLEIMKEKELVELRKVIFLGTKELKIAFPKKL